MRIKNVLTAALAVTMFAAALAAEGRAAPDFNAVTIEGKKFSLSDYEGKVVILDFWATWCPPCKAEIPGFIELVKEYGSDGLVIIGAAVDEPKKVKKFAKDYGINYPVFIADAKLANAFGGIMGLPTTFVIGRDGKIKQAYVDFRPKSVFEKHFKELDGV
ncbi:MAG TPA: TlpA disulfide reductase family protein [Candidatus Goldiibacteriota bacterium]|nr:TlpA disulfide reductase family protein [Candidatus Goldiibacteriota bacterium]